MAVELRKRFWRGMGHGLSARGAVPDELAARRGPQFGGQIDRPSLTIAPVTQFVKERKPKWFRGVDRQLPLWFPWRKRLSYPSGIVVSMNRLDTTERTRIVAGIA